MQMRRPIFAYRAQTAPSQHAKKAKLESIQEHTAQPVQSPSLMSAINRGDTSLVSALQQAVTTQPPLGLRLVSQLQQRYGNYRVEQILQAARRKDGGSEVDADVEGEIQRARGSGHALDTNVRTQMEAAFGVDFTDVRVHTDTRADSLNRALNARALTTERDIFFRQGAYDPGSSSGRGLLAHELTHVVQQAHGRTSSLRALGGDPAVREALEQEAEAVQKHVKQGVHAAMIKGSMPVPQKALQPFALSKEVPELKAFQRQGNGMDQDDEVRRTEPRFELVEAHIPTPVPPTETEEEVVETATQMTPAVQEANGGGGGPSVGDIVNVAKTAWDIMKDGRPVVNASTDYANAVPSGVSWTALTGWADEPMWLRWRYHTASPVGLNETTVNFKLTWDYNGNRRGRGRFINHATCIIESHDQAWGNTFESTAVIRNPINRGTVANPIAGLPVDITWREHNILQNFGGTWEFEVRGNGAWRQR